MSLSLRNAGDTVRLLSPDETLVSSIEYPVIKNGIAYALSDEGYCVTIQPTPGMENQCVSPIKKIAKTKSASKSVGTVKKVSPQVRSYAASYRAQLQSDDPEILPEIVIPPSASGNVVWITLAFILVLFCLVSGFLLAIKQGFIMISMPMKHTAIVPES